MMMVGALGVLVTMIYMHTYDYSINVHILYRYELYKWW